jgi:hypothetical protein
LYTTLPRLPEELDVLIVRKPDARNPSSYKDFRVRKRKVLQLLRFLKKHNPYYARVTIRPSSDVDLPVDGDISDRLPNVSTRHQTNASTSTTSDDPEEDSFEPDELAQEQTSFLPAFLPGPTEVETIRAKMRSNGLVQTVEQSEPIAWPAQGDALSEFTTDGLFTKAFPALFPLGKADFSLSRRSTLALYEWVKHLMRYRDPRFARHPRFRFFALNLIFRHRAMGRGKFLFSKDIGSRDMTVGQLRHALSHDGGHILASKIVRCLQTVRGTRPYWYMEGAKLRDMIEQIGPPTLFYTLSMADLSWPDLHRLMPDDPFRDGLLPGESYRIRCRNLANNPHIVASYLSVKHQHLRETVSQHLSSASPAALVDFWYRVEWQARGSGTLFFQFTKLVVPQQVTFVQVIFTAFCGLRTRCKLKTSTGKILAISPPFKSISPTFSRRSIQIHSDRAVILTAYLKTCCRPTLGCCGILRVTIATSVTAAKNTENCKTVCERVSRFNATETVPVGSIFLIQFLFAPSLL